MEPEREVIALDADRAYYRNWLRDLRSPEETASNVWDENDWLATRDACKIVLLSNN